MSDRFSDGWIEQIMAEQRHMRVVVAELRQFVTRPRPEIRATGAHRWATELAERLLRLHDEMYRHFRFEEGSELLGKLEESHPEAGRDAAMTSGQHVELLDSVRQLISDALAYSAGLQAGDGRLRARTARVLEDLARHQQAEDHLLQRLEYRDLGAGD